MSIDTTEPTTVPKLPEPALDVKTQTQPEAAGYIKLATNDHGPVGDGVPAKYKTHRAAGALMVDIYVQPQYGPELTLVIPKYKHARDYHQAALYTEDGMLLTFIYDPEHEDAVAFGVGAKFTIVWKSQDARGWWTTEAGND